MSELFIPLFDQKWHFYKCWNELEFYLFCSSCFQQRPLFSAHCSLPLIPFSAPFSLSLSPAFDQFRALSPILFHSTNVNKSKRWKSASKNIFNLYTFTDDVAVVGHSLAQFTVVLYELVWYLANQIAFITFLWNIRFNRKLSCFYVIPFRFTAFPFECSAACSNTFFLSLCLIQCNRITFRNSYVY